MDSSKFFAALAIVFVLALGFLASVSNTEASAQGDDRWYVGEGVEQDTFVTYRIQDIGTNNRVPFLITIYFQEQDEDGVWIAPTFVVTQGKVLEGTLRLAETSLVPLAGGDLVPSEMRPYVSGYQNTLTFLEAYAPKTAPKSLSQISWGNVAGTGASPISPAGKETVTVEGGTFDTTVISYSRGSTVNKIWVADNFPYPVKALVYAEVTSPPAPVRYEFELIEQGQGRPEAPTSEEEIPTPPIRRSTVTELYQIELDWEPVSIMPEQEVEFGISFFDQAGLPEQRVSYDFIVTDSQGNTLLEKKNQLADDGMGFQKATFADGGGKTITVKIIAVGGVDTSQFIESADFNIVVVPEFPVSAAIVAAVVIGLAVAITRLRGSTSLGSVFGGRNPL